MSYTAGSELAVTESGISQDIIPACRETPVRDVLNQNTVVHPKKEGPRLSRRGPSHLLRHRMSNVTQVPRSTYRRRCQQGSTASTVKPGAFTPPSDTSWIEPVDVGIHGPVTGPAAVRSPSYVASTLPSASLT